MNKTSKLNLPVVSIVVPVYNDEAYITRALDSCIGQTLKSIEVICVDDASTDKSIKMVKNYAKKDSRIRLIKQPKNLSALQARRVGIENATADYILFLDGDDELSPRAAELTYKKAIKENADIVSFCPELVMNAGRVEESFAKSLLPPTDELSGIDIVGTIFKPGTHAQCQLWRYLFDKNLLLKAYERVPKNKAVYRANDIMISFVAIAYAKHYVHISDFLYRYHLDDGGSGHDSINYEKFLYYAQAIDSVEYIPRLLVEGDFNTADFKIIKECYESLRLRIIANTTQYATLKTLPEFTKQSIDYILKRISLDDVIISLATFMPGALPVFREQIKFDEARKNSKNIIIYTSNLATGGAQGVVVSQASYLASSGYNVMILVRTAGKVVFDIPDAVQVKVLKGDTTITKLQYFLETIEEFKPGVFIDHYVLYNRTWPFYSMLAKAHRVKTVGWIHNFALRPAHDLSKMGSFLQNYLSILDMIVTLSKRDTAYWKILGHENVYYLPNPPSPLLLNNKLAAKPKKAPNETMNLIWYGRLQQTTKRIYSLLSVSRALLRLTPNFKLTIVGPESNDLTYAMLNKRIEDYGLQDNVFVVGEKHGKDLINEIKSAHIFISTSSIEGYPLVVTEAQSFGLPVIMYELPWIGFVENNKGLIEVKQNHSKDVARHIYNLFENPTLYREMSVGSIDAVKKYFSYDFAKLYSQLIKGTLPKEYSPEPSLDDARFFFEWFNHYIGDNSNKYDRLSKRSLKYQADSNELRALKHSFAHKLGQKAAKPMRSVKIRLKRG